jgi:hypothetical protein
MSLGLTNIEVILPNNHIKFVRWFVGSLVRWFVGSLVRWLVGSLARLNAAPLLLIIWLLTNVQKLLISF